MAVQTVLQSSQDQAALLVSGQDYEQWIRHGSMADHPMDSASNMEEPAQGQSCHIALHFSEMSEMISPFILGVVIL